MAGKRFRWSLLLLLLGCGRDDINCYTRGEQCERNTEHHTETVTERITVVTQPAEGTPGPAGQPGPPGDRGERGTDGHSCSVVQTNTGATIQCEDGTSADIYHGDTGLSGTSCSVVQVDGGAVVYCEDGTSAEINDGEDFRPGKGKK